MRIGFFGTPDIASHVLQRRAAPPPALERPPITTALETGVRVIDGMLTCGVGQRMGIFAGSGVGKSTLLGMVARGAKADVVVIGLVGERGREAQEFLQHQLGAAGLARAVVIIATSDQPALLRLKAAWLATSIAEEFREQGAHVLLLLDSVTRVALAQREIGLAIGEPPALRGFPPSVFALLPRLLERSGASKHGAVTAFYSVLVEGDDMNEPVTDTVRSVLDGHIVLSRRLAAENMYPAIDISHSLSRVMPQVTTSPHHAAAARLRDALATYERHQDLIAIGAYVHGSSPAIDAALALHPKIQAFRRQSPDQLEPFAHTLATLDEATWERGG